MMDSYLSFIVKQHDIYVISELGHRAQYKGHSRNDDYGHWGESEDLKKKLSDVDEEYLVFGVACLGWRLFNIPGLLKNKLIINY